ncbi:MAG TPA: hypothetical protein VGB87_19150 [Vicinamibacteria bacterium]
MRPASSRWPFGGMALAALVALPVPGAAQGVLAFARLSLVESRVELARKGGPWQAAAEGGPLQVGEALRTGPEAVARLELPWMALTLGPGATLGFPDAYLLSASLESGRALVDSPSREALKIVTAEAEVRGQGRAVVRRDGKATTVSCLAGKFVVQGGEASVTLTAGRGTVVASGRPPSPPEAVPAALSEGQWPGADPVYVAPGEPVELRWKGRAASASYVVELLPVGSDSVLLQREVKDPPARIAVPWEGAFRWRVSARDARGLEGMPSADGLIAVDSR